MKPGSLSGQPVKLGNMARAEDYRRLADDEAALAKRAISNESRAQHYAMAAYYTRLGGGEGEVGDRDGDHEGTLTRRSDGPSNTHPVSTMTLGNRCASFGRRLTLPPRQ